MMPSRHFRFGSKTPDPEFPVVATSRINVENFVCKVKGSTRGETIWDSVACMASTTMTGSPGQGGASHSLNSYQPGLSSQPLPHAHPCTAPTPTWRNAHDGLREANSHAHAIEAAPELNTRALGKCARAAQIPSVLPLSTTTMSLAQARWDSVRLIFCSSLYVSRTGII